MGEVERAALIALAVAAIGGCDLVWRVDSFKPPPPEVDASPDSTIPPNIAFVSSMKVAPGKLGGVAGADALCNQLAVAGGLEGTYVAWLSTTAESARSRVEATNPRGWVRPDGKPFADTVDDIAHGRIWYPLRITETMIDLVATGVDTDLVVATATGQDGLYIPGVGCIDFTMQVGNTATGAADGGVFSWTTAGSVACTTPMRIYCFGVDHSVPVTLQPESDRLAFSTASDYASGAGRAGFDQQCQIEATQAGLGMRTFHAALPTSVDTALARFTLGVPWVRGDHVTVIGADGAMEAPIVEDATGTTMLGNVAWSGATALGLRPASSAQTCSNWISAAAGSSVKLGDTTRSGPDGFGGIMGNCAGGYRVYCLQD